MNASRYGLFAFAARLALTLNVIALQNSAPLAQSVTLRSRQVTVKLPAGCTAGLRAAPGFRQR